MAAPIRTGELNKRIKLQQRSTAQDTTGGQSTVWTDTATVWASVQPVSGSEKMAAAAMQTGVSHLITIRYQPQFADPKVMATMRAVLVKDGVQRLFNIKDSRDDDERRRYIILDAEEGLNDG